MSRGTNTSLPRGDVASSWTCRSACAREPPFRTAGPAPGGRLANWPEQVGQRIFELQDLVALAVLPGGNLVQQHPGAVVHARELVMAHLIRRASASHSPNTKAPSSDRRMVDEMRTSRTFPFPPRRAPPNATIRSASAGTAAPTRSRGSAMWRSADRDLLETSHKCLPLAAIFPMVNGLAH